MTTDNLPKPQRDAPRLIGRGKFGQPERPAKVEENRKPRPKIVELLDCKDARVALAAANSILDKAFAKPAQSLAAKVETLDVGRLWLEAMKLNDAPPPAKTIEGEAVQATHIVNGMATPLVEGRDDTTHEPRAREP
jgi:hypothetical protein